MLYLEWHVKKEIETLIMKKKIILNSLGKYNKEKGKEERRRRFQKYNLPFPILYP